VLINLFNIRRRKIPFLPSQQILTKKPSLILRNLLEHLTLKDTQNLVMRRGIVVCYSEQVGLILSGEFCAETDRFGVTSLRDLEFWCCRDCLFIDSVAGGHAEWHFFYIAVDGVVDVEILITSAFNRLNELLLHVGSQQRRKTKLLLRRPHIPQRLILLTRINHHILEVNILDKSGVHLYQLVNGLR
jgi:hypothetical protein